MSTVPDLAHLAVGSAVAGVGLGWLVATASWRRAAAVWKSIATDAEADLAAERQLNGYFARLLRDEPGMHEARAKVVAALESMRLQQKGGFPC